MFRRLSVFLHVQFDMVWLGRGLKLDDVAYLSEMLMV